MPTISLSRGPVSYSDDGTGPVVVLLHATLHDRTDYDAVVAALTPTNRVIALDWPGHGESPSPIAPLREGAVLYGEVLAEFVLALGLHHVVVVGNSVGGYAACNLALTHPELVAGLVIAQGSGFVPTTPFVKAFCSLQGRPWAVRTAFRHSVPRYMQPRSAHDELIVEQVIARSQTREGARTAANLWASFNDPRQDLRRRGAAITAPTLITWGMLDKSLKVEWGKAIHSAIPHSAWVEMDTGHVPFTSDPSTWLSIVGPFIAEAHASPTGHRHARLDLGDGGEQ
ncbi:alpha/beta fold hydrolase [Nocardia noduli]|uniref:alpha/beta fold hydrolase n=1 Tax=Nocardia noduli TaxID=2815722 RepID=UPI001C21C9E1|nr:alpha/beta hydrolase [Nocardia noduli]